MARPPFIPDRAQARIMHSLIRQVDRMAEADAHFTWLILAAKEAGIPIEHIAKAAGITVKTVYSRLAKAAK